MRKPCALWDVCCGGLLLRSVFFFTPLFMSRCFVGEICLKGTKPKTVERTELRHVRRGSDGTER